MSLLRLALEALDTIDAELCDEVIARDRDLDAEYAAGLRRPVESRDGGTAPISRGQSRRPSS